MEREIKFRGKDSKGEWRYGDLFHSKQLDSVVCICDNDGNNIVFSESVGQFTGLKDKNGVDIYEGDIIVIPEHYPFFVEGKPNYIGVVEWVYSQWQYIYYLHKDSTASGISNGINVGLNDDGVSENSETYFYVIGNIHDNPTLLQR